MKAFKKERKKYGFDSRETWCLQQTSAMWLYEHLKMYLKYAGKIVNLDHYTFEIQKVIVDPKIWEETYIPELDKYIHLSEPQEMTQKEAISLCCKYLKAFITTDQRRKKTEKEHEGSPLAVYAAEVIDNTKGQQAFRIYAEIFPAMWW